jgi:hypothetical protein
MNPLSEVAEKIRSKNAGPFWLTIDIFCGSPEAFARICAGLDAKTAARLLGMPETEIQRFEIEDLAVLKISLPRPHIQGTRLDRDMHGASYSNLLSDVLV